ncbi:hypothetical protein NFI96_011976 [Prochilodus magdalenae]|nr:hypothetical protein NFI96_011976 [Prochilodus magdalenae]
MQRSWDLTPFRLFCSSVAEDDHGPTQTCVGWTLGNIYPVVGWRLGNVYPVVGWRLGNVYPVVSWRLGKIYPGVSWRLGNVYPGVGWTLGNIYPGVGWRLGNVYPGVGWRLGNIYPGVGWRSGKVHPVVGWRLGNVYSVVGWRLGNVHPVMGWRSGKVYPVVGWRLGNVYPVVGWRLGNVYPVVGWRLGNVYPVVGWRLGNVYPVVGWRTGKGAPIQSWAGGWRTSTQSWAGGWGTSTQSWAGGWGTSTQSWAGGRGGLSRRELEVSCGLEVGERLSSRGLEVGERISSRGLEVGERISSHGLEVGERLSSRGLEVGERISSRGLEVGERLSSRGLEVGERISSRGLEVGERLSSRGLEVGERISSRGLEVGERISSRGLEVGERISSRGLEVGERISSRGLEVGERLSRLELEVGERLSRRGLEVGKRLSRLELEVGERLSRRGLEVGERLSSRRLEVREGPSSRELEVGEGLSSRGLEVGERLSSRRLEVGEGPSSRELEVGEGSAYPVVGWRSGKGFYELFPGFFPAQPTGVVPDCHGVTQNGSGSSSVTSPALVLVETPNEPVCGGTVVSTKMNGVSSHVQKTWCPSTSTPTAPSAGTVAPPHEKQTCAINNVLSLHLSLLPSLFIVALLSFFERRQKVFSFEERFPYLRGRFGIVVPLDFIGSLRNRWSYAFAIGAATPQMITLFTGGVIPFEVPKFLMGLVYLLAVFEVGVANLPFFVCLSTTQRGLGGALGLLYTLAWLAVAVWNVRCVNVSCDRSTLFGNVMCYDWVTRWPYFLCLGFLLLRFGLMLVKSVKNRLHNNHKQHAPKQGLNQYPGGHHPQGISRVSAKGPNVRPCVEHRASSVHLLYGVGLILPPALLDSQPTFDRTSTITVKLHLNPIGGFSSRGTVFPHKVPVLCDHGCLRNIQTLLNRCPGATGVCTHALDDAPVDDNEVLQAHQYRYVQSLLRRPHERAPEKTCFQRRVYDWDPCFKFPNRMITTAVISLFGLYMLIAVEQIFFARSVSMLKKFRSNPREEYLNYAIYPWYIVTALSALASVCHIGHMLVCYRKQMRRLWAGDRSFLPEKYQVANSAASLAALLRYPGCQIVFTIWGYLIVQFALVGFGSIFVAVVIIPILLTGFVTWLINLLTFMGDLLVVLVLLKIQFILVRIFFLQDKLTPQDKEKPLAINNRKVYHNLNYFLFLHNVILGIWTCVLRLLSTAFVCLLLVFQIHQTTMPRGFEALDNGYRVWIGMIMSDHYHSNPVMVCFCHLLLKRTLERHTTNRAYSRLNSTSGRPQEVRVRARWLLLYTLLKNPKLIRLRKHWNTNNDNQAQLAVVWATMQAQQWGAVAVV